MILRILFLLIGFQLVSCTSTGEKRKENVDLKVPIKKERILPKQDVPVTVKSSIDNRFTEEFVVVNAFDTRILYDLKYASTDNFMHRKLYDTLNKVYVRSYVAKKLALAQKELSRINNGYHLMVYDGVRPVQVQWEMWNALDSIPPARRGLFVSNPRNGSVHNYGMAVDLTIVDENKQPLDMGAGYDDIRKIAYPSEEAYFLKSGELKEFQVEHRKLLRFVMKKAGFVNIPSEWWHFNAMTRAQVKTKYKLVENEFILE